MSDARSSPVRLAEALRLLHESLPARVNFTIGRSEGGAALDWTIVVQVPDPSTGGDRYSRASCGTDLGVVVEEALKHYRRWVRAAPRPPKLAAPGAAARHDDDRRQKDAS